MTTFPQQLSLGVSLSDDATFENYYVSPREIQNSLVLNSLRELLNGSQDPYIFLWGAKGAGLSHLLQASCREAQIKGLSIHYMPLQDMLAYNPEEVFSDLEQLDLVCLDNLDAVVGKREWEVAIFAFFNASRDRKKSLIVSAHQNPRELTFALEDLRSRFQWGTTYHVAQLTDIDKQHALQIRAKARGLELSDEVAQFLIMRLPRNMPELFSTLVKLDHASLAEQRKLTIPFIKKILAL